MGGLIHRDNRRAAVIIADVIDLVRTAERDPIPTGEGVRTAVPSRNPGQPEKMPRQTRAGILSGALAAAEAALAGSAMETDKFSPVNPAALEMYRAMRPVIPTHRGEMLRQGAILAIIPTTKRPGQPGKRVPMGPA